MYSWPRGDSRLHECSHENPFSSTVPSYLVYPSLLPHYLTQDLTAQGLLASYFLCPPCCSPDTLDSRLIMPPPVDLYTHLAFLCTRIYPHTYLSGAHLQYSDTVPPMRLDGPIKRIRGLSLSLVQLLITFVFSRLQNKMYPSSSSRSSSASSLAQSLSLRLAFPPIPSRSASPRLNRQSGNLVDPYYHVAV